MGQKYLSKPVTLRYDLQKTWLLNLKPVDSSIAMRAPLSTDIQPLEWGAVIKAAQEMQALMAIIHTDFDYEEITKIKVSLKNDFYFIFSLVVETPDNPRFDEFLVFLVFAFCAVEYTDPHLNAVFVKLKNKNKDTIAKLEKKSFPISKK